MMTDLTATGESKGTNSGTGCVGRTIGGSQIKEKLASALRCFARSETSGNVTAVPILVESAPFLCKVSLWVRRRRPDYNPVYSI